MNLGFRRKFENNDHESVRNLEFSERRGIRERMKLMLKRLNMHGRIASTRRRNKSSRTLMMSLNIAFKQTFHA